MASGNTHIACTICTQDCISCEQHSSGCFGRKVQVGEVLGMMWFLLLFGCPVYALHSSLALGQSIPKWDSGAILGIYLGLSQKHACPVALVIKPTIGSVSMQSCNFWQFLQISVFQSCRDYIAFCMAETCWVCPWRWVQWEMIVLISESHLDSWTTSTN